MVFTKKVAPKQTGRVNLFGYPNRWKSKYGTSFLFPTKNPYIRMEKRLKTSLGGKIVTEGTGKTAKKYVVGGWSKTVFGVEKRPYYARQPYYSRPLAVEGKKVLANNTVLSRTTEIEAKARAEEQARKQAQLRANMEELAVMQEKMKYAPLPKKGRYI